MEKNAINIVAVRSRNYHTLVLQKVKYDESINQSEEEHLNVILTPAGIKVMLLECLPVCRMDATEGKLAASSQVDKLKHIDEVETL